MPRPSAVLSSILGLFFLLITSILAVAEPPGGCPTDMAAYFPLNESVTGSYADAALGNNAACRAAGNCPEPAADGKIGRAQDFVRANTDGINAPGGSFNWAADGSFSIEFWMNKSTVCSGATTTENEVIVGRAGESGDGLNHFWVGVNCNSTDGQGKIKFNLLDKNGGTAALSDVSVLDSQWHHVVAVRDGSQGKHFIYVDGRKAGTATHTYTSAFESGKALNIGWIDLTGGYHYDGRLDEVAVHNRALGDNEIKMHYYLARAYCSTCDAPIAIMPLGDSLTKGSTGLTIPESDKISYRYRLSLLMDAAGVQYDLVGSQLHGDTSGYVFDYNHEGWGGWTANQIRDNVTGFLNANPADVVMLHIGTNDISGQTAAGIAAEVKQILDNIDQWEAANRRDVTVVLARIINRQGYVCGNSNETNTFNNLVEAIALKRLDPTQAGFTGGFYGQVDKIILVDQECGAGINYTTEMNDNIHPKQSAFDKMAPVWWAALGGFLPACTPTSPTAPVITSAPVTTGYAGYAYSYDVNASGNPIPQYRLIGSPPAAMNIDSASGLITWTPPAVGVYSVAVEAYNSVSATQQHFSIVVTDSPACPPGIAHYWKLDETGGAPYQDFIGSADAGCTNCPAATAGKVAGAQSFNGSQSLSAPNTDSFNAAITAMAWINPADLSQTSPDEGIVGKANSFLMDIEEDGNKLSFSIYQGATIQECEPDSAHLTQGQWTHVAATWDGNNIRIYSNGSLIKTCDKPNVNFNANNSPYVIGVSPYDAARLFKGAIDEVAVFSRALDADEIAAAHSAGTAGKGYCATASTGAITIVKDADPETAQAFSFGGDLGPFSLTDTGTGTNNVTTFTGLAPGTYAITETVPLGWNLTQAVCVGGQFAAVSGGVSVNLQAGDHVTCTFSNRELVHTGCPESAIHYWKLNEASGSVYEDFIGGLHADCLGSADACPQAQAGIAFGAQDFDGASQRIRTETGGLNPASQITLMAWVNPRTVAGHDRAILYKEGALGFELESDHNGCPDFWLFQNGALKELQPQCTVPLNQWSHVAATYDGSAMKVYLNGGLIQSLNVSGPMDVNDNEITIGYSLWQDIDRWFDGKIDELIMLESALTQTEIQQYMAMAPQEYCTGSSCAHDYDFDRDVDGWDLSEFIRRGGTNVAGMAAEFGLLCP